MSSDPQRVQSVFLAAVEAPPPERAALIDRECGEDHLLRRRVETLLKAHDEPGDFLGSRHSEIEPTIDTRLCEGPGTIIGQYKLMEEVGDGGMGVVFVAEQQEPVRRKVALKIIKPGMGSKEVISRFEAERQALALMDHPNIARVLDAGTTDSGLPYFVMELVRGIPICDYCDANNLSTGERLDLFLPICHAIQHAHQKGIVHRDIKPSNVMVTLHDGVAVPKVIDFGVAKAISQRLTERTVYTRYAQMIGTPLYMSPEQAELSGLDIDTRSDVYSLGVLLYELLTGTTPFDKKRLCEAAYDELLRIIREEEPPKPSTRISSLGDTAVAVSAHRRTEPKRLGQLLHGDLDWIVMTALEKDRTRRYETANGFAADIKRYLDDEPVLARPPSAVYRFRKFARRNKAVMTTVSLVAASLVLGVIVSSWLAIRANVQHDRAVTAERVARQEAQRAVAAERTANRERNSARDAERRAQEQRDETRRLLYPAEMIAVQQAWSAGDLAGAMKVLERHVPQENEEDLRGFYWTCLRRLCDRSLARKPMQYPERISSVALSPDGKLVAATSSVYANLVYMWEVATGDRVGPELEGQAVACSPNETTFAIRDGSGIRLWNPGTGTRKSILPYSGGPVRVLAFSGDGSRLATGGFNKKVHVWNLSEGGKPRVFEGPEWVVFSVALSPDGRWVAAVAPPQLFLWDVEGDGQPIVLEQDVDSASCVAFANDGTTLASGGWDGRIKLWDIETRRQKGVLRTRNVAVVYSLASSSDGRLAAGAEDGSVTVWSLDDREQIDVLKGHQHTVWAVAFSSDNRTLASGSMDGEVRTWDVANRRPPDGLKHPTQQFTGVAFSPDGSVVATASTDHVVMLWDAQTGEQLQALPAHRASIYDIAFSPSGDWLAAVSSFDETIRVWDLALGTDRALLKQFLPLAVAFSPDGQTIAVGGAGAQLHLWDHATGTRGLECKGHHNAQIRALAISPDGQIVASGSWDRNIVLWEASTGRYVVTLKGHDRDVRCLAFSPDGKTLASCSDDGTVKLWDVVERKERETLAGHTATVFSVAFSPDGQILASGGGDNTVKLWYLGKNREPESLPTDAPAVSVAFSPRGETLACASGNAVRFWRTVDVQESDQLDRRWDLQRRARAIVEAGPQEQRRVLADVRKHLGAIAAKELTLRDVILGTATAWRLENGGHAELAEEAFQSFAEALATSGKPKAHRLADRWEAKLRERRDRLRADEHLKKANEFVVAGEPSKAIEELSLAVELKPNSLLILRKRGQLYARLGQWEKASVDYARIVALMPSRDFTWLQAAPLFVLADNPEGYREHCRGMLARFGQSDEAQAAERTSKACLLLPGPVEALQPSLNALQNALQDGSAPRRLRKWGFLTLALAAHRAGDAESAIECIDQVRHCPDYRPAGPEKAISLCLEAMSLQRLEETGKAGQTLADANNLTSDYFARLAAGEVSVEHDWLIAEVLRREATKSISRPAEHPDSDTNKAPKHQEHSDRKSLDRFESGMRRPGWQHQITIIHTIVSEAPESATGNARVVHTFGRVPVKVHVGDAGVFW